MQKNNTTKIEAQGGEIITRNSYGDVAIIPKNLVKKYQAYMKAACDECIDELVASLPAMSQYAADGTVISGDSEKETESSAEESIITTGLNALRKVGRKLNVLNINVPDYTDKGDFNTAYKYAREKQNTTGKTIDSGLFMWNGKKYTTEDSGIKKSAAQITEEQNPEFTNMYRKYMYDQYADPKLAEKKYQDMLTLHNKYGNPKVTIGVRTEDNPTGRAHYVHDSNEMFIYGNKQSKDPKVKATPEDLIRDYWNELLHSRQKVDLKDKFYDQDQADNLKYPNYEDQYNDPNTLEGVHYTEGPALENRLLYRDYDLEEHVDYTKERTQILNKYIGKQFDPYKNQDELRVIQKALGEKGYSMSKSQKSDGTYDGIYGEETKKALEEYRQAIKNPKSKRKQ